MSDTGQTGMSETQTDFSRWNIIFPSTTLLAYFLVPIGHLHKKVKNQLSVSTAQSPLSANLHWYF